MTTSNPRRGGILFGLLASALLVICLMVVGGIFLARSIHVQSTTRNGGDYVSIDTPAGHLTVHAHEKSGAVVADIPTYPGARKEKDSGGDAVVQWTSNGNVDHGFSVSASETVTPDRMDKVLAYYRTQLPNWMIVNEDDGAVRLELHDGGYKRIIAIHQKHDGTHIGVASVGEPASN